MSRTRGRPTGLTEAGSDQCTRVRCRFSGALDPAAGRRRATAAADDLDVGHPKLVQCRVQQLLFFRCEIALGLLLDNVQQIDVVFRQIGSA